MHRPSTSDLLDAWERGLALPASDRPLALLSAPDDDSSAEGRIEQLPLGERDARLLDLREWAFGPHLAAVAHCPSCGAELELAFETDDVRSATGRPSPDSGASLLVGDVEVHYQLPDSVVIREAAQAPTLEAARGAVLRRCVLSATRGGAALEPESLPADVVERLEDAMAKRDPQADVHVAVSCADCGHVSQAVFDAGTYVWVEVDRWARRLLVDVARLAAAFGWTERDVLRMSASRRGAYLELVGG
jgi:hypothetical protein